MANDREVEVMGPKDLIVFVPVLTSNIAMCWQIGRLSPVGFFQAFSLSDHLVAAAAAIPVALTFAIISTGHLFIESRLEKPRGWQLIAATLVTTPLGLVAIYFLTSRFGHPLFSFVGLWTLIALVVSFGALELLLIGFRRSVTSFEGLVLIFVIASILSFSFAREATSDLIENSAINANDWATITTKKSEVFSGVQIMYGERGLLTYDPLSRKLRFTRADEIARIEMPLKP